jgi:hypothetical protein
VISRNFMSQSWGAGESMTGVVFMVYRERETGRAIGIAAVGRPWGREEVDVELRGVVVIRYGRRAARWRRCARATRW